MHTSLVVVCSEGGVVVGFFTGVVIGGEVLVEFSWSIIGVGKVAWVNAGDRVG